MLAEKKDRANLILHRAEHSFIVFNRYPYTSGHLMIVPNRHIGNLEKLPEATLNEMMALSKLAVKALRTEFTPRGFNHRDESWTIRRRRSSRTSAPSHRASLGRR